MHSNNDANQLSPVHTGDKVECRSDFRHSGDKTQ